jgi:hypothetical protein
MLIVTVGGWFICLHSDREVKNDLLYDFSTSLRIEQEQFDPT